MWALVCVTAGFRILPLSSALLKLEETQFRLVSLFSPGKCLTFFWPWGFDVEGRKSGAGRRGLPCRGGHQPLPGPAEGRAARNMPTFTTRKGPSSSAIMSALQRDGSRVPPHPVPAQSDDEGDGGQERGAAVLRGDRYATGKEHLPFCGHFGNCCDIWVTFYFVL